MTTRTTALLGTIAAGVLGATALAHAHGGTIIGTSTEGSSYFYNEHSIPTIWNETNGQLDQGAHASPMPDVAPPADSGLQVHDVCYGIYDQTDVVAWQVPHGAYRFNYVPFQHACAGFGDDQEDWVALYREKYSERDENGAITGEFNLHHFGNLKPVCESLGGTFVAKDEFVLVFPTATFTECGGHGGHGG